MLGLMFCSFRLEILADVCPGSHSQGHGSSCNHSPGSPCRLHVRTGEAQPPRKESYVSLLPGHPDQAWDLENCDLNS